MLNSSFYPTPRHLILKMVSKIKNNNTTTILEPSAGKGDIVEYFQEHFRGDVFAIEKDETLQATLRGKGINLIDSDFLTFAGADKFDVIIANPPFNEGDKHLLKAIDVMYNGEIVFLLNAETLKNPHTNIRKLLVKKLHELKADVEYIQNAFLDAERKTKVEIAIVYIKIENKVENDLFEGVDDIAQKVSTEAIEDSSEVAALNSIKNMVDDYNRIVEVGQETIVSYYKNYRHIGQFISLKNQENKGHYNSETLTQIMRDNLNGFLRVVRKHYWEKVLSLDAVQSRLTSAKRDEFYNKLTKQAYMDFTEHNIKQFIINLINGFEDTLIEAVIKLFDDMTRNFAWDEDLHNGNVHYFNGWKTNKAFFVNKKVILPYYNFIGWSGQWAVDHRDKQKLHDIDLVMNYFDGGFDYLSITDSLNSSFVRDQNRKVLSTFFEISVFKKGTIHLTFRDEDVLRRFNVTACKGKGWLPQDYGLKPFEQLSYEKQEIVKSFEGPNAYNKNIGKEIFKIKNPVNLMLNYNPNTDKGENKMAKPKITLAKLEELAGEMNTVMGLDPEIDVNEYDNKKELQDRIVEETKDENDECQIYQSDFIGGKTEDKEGEPKFSKNAWAVLKALDVEPIEEESEPKSEKEDPPQKKTPPKKKAPVKKIPGKKEESKKKVEKKEESERKGKVRYTRFDSFATTVKSGTKNIEKIIEKSNALYIEHGGTDNMNVSKQQLSFAIKTLASFGLASIEKDILKINFKIK